jgi:hypothetical protein
MLGELGWTGTLFFAVLVIGLPLAVAWLSGIILKTHEAGQVLSIVTAALSVISKRSRMALDAFCCSAGRKALPRRVQRELGNRRDLAYCYANWGLLAREQRDRNYGT